MTEKIQTHVIHENGRMVARQLLKVVPRVGEQIRLGGEGNEKYFIVTLVIHCLDEEGPYPRINIGVVDEAIDEAREDTCR